MKKWIVFNKAYINVDKIVYVRMMTSYKDRNERIERLTNDLHRYVEDNKEFKRIIYEREQEIERYINQLKKEREERITQPFKHGNCCE
jgi:predicted RNase H-like nuclease (RuvC/YqgF family)